jgi:hypothetical protein
MAKPDNADQWLSEIDLATVFTMFSANGVTEILYKVLPKNANSKNQVYLASDLSQLGKIPSGEVTSHLSTSEKNGKQEAVFRSALDFRWLDQNGQQYPAPGAKLIFYPQYPEVRLSGFLQGSKYAPTSLWVKEKRGAEPSRILMLGLGNGTKIFAITLPPEAPAAKEILASGPHAAYSTDDKEGVLRILPMPGQEVGDGFHELMRELCSIYRRGWVPSTRLAPNGNLVPCNASNCNGNTLESLLGIKSNGYSQPDFRGWEIKARQVTNADKPGGSIVTLFTPEPTAGVYTDEGVEAFIRRYGYADTQGREDRLNVCGIHRANQAAHERTSLRLVLDGFNPETGKYTSTGAIQLLDAKENVAAAWSFAKLLDHWKAKHAHAAFVPSQASKVGERQYRYGRNILLGEGAEFRLLLNAVHEGKVYYDPGIKLEGISTSNPKAKKRSQFRVASKDLPALYVASRIVDACAEASRLPE